MIAHLSGKLVEKNPTDLVVECNGVGYFLNISLHTFSQIPDQENIFIYTYLQVREDAQTLFGFADKLERSLFKKLISVSGIGASTARTMLSSLSPDQVMSAIHSENVEEIKSVKGIGAKTAQRVIIDLKDKISDLGEADVNKILTPQRNTHKEEALSALETLGYTRKQSEKVVKKILSNNPEATVEAIIKLSLKNL
ncbi:Holliday junction branch migration protein RuvA [Mesonia maritima]|uniref:Holliday junction branch migration complex subunit RuvA n=1 Tax=Mesonia maritima TaxID=1793873 RepID=A0ABU1K3H6_9FLAO|nr:Holliday junction branch migration protein RuvA [Mesonia maritima]MDR6300170.1 Holliday junction DNA helicase RuvA [Mesonia maritima]